MMKIILFLTVISLANVGCKPSDGTKIKTDELIGQWMWTSTDGGFAYHIHENPNTTSKSIHLTLKSNYHYSILENGKEVAKGIYELTEQKSIHSGKMERFITIAEDLDKVVLTGIIGIKDASELFISDNHPDGLGSKFIKMN